MSATLQFDHHIGCGELYDLPERERPCTCGVSEIQDRIAELEAQLATARADALEEAAKVAERRDDCKSHAPGTCPHSDAINARKEAAEIRALAGKPPEARYTLEQVEAAFEVSSTNLAMGMEDVDLADWPSIRAALTGNP